MRRFLFPLLVIASPATAWEFSANPVCTLSHQAGSMAVELQYDPRLDAPYSISLSVPTGWPNAPLFGLEFSGESALTITTPEHSLSDDGTTLTVRDRGFGNVLDGLEFNQTATAFSGATTRQMSLDGAAKAVRAFRACIGQPAV